MFVCVTWEADFPSLEDQGLALSKWIRRPTGIALWQTGFSTFVPSLRLQPTRSHERTRVDRVLGVAGIFSLTRPAELHFILEMRERCCGCISWRPPIRCSFALPPAEKCCRTSGWVGVCSWEAEAGRGSRIGVETGRKSASQFPACRGVTIKVDPRVLVLLERTASVANGG
jgi:hypothetical protein